MTVFSPLYINFFRLVLLLAGSLLFRFPAPVHSFGTRSFFTRIRQQQQQQQQQHSHQTTFLPSSVSGRQDHSSNDDNNIKNSNAASATTAMVNRGKYNISLLLIDHYDSFTYNLYDMLAQLTVEPPQVIAKDALPTFNPDEWKHIDGIILSPGPGTPQEQPPLSHQSILANPALPILGVCLGHQLLALAYGGDVGKAPKPIHGEDHWISSTSTTTTTTDNDNDNDNKLFENLPTSFRVVRYHSLAASNLPVAKLQVTATSANDNVIQAIQHVSNPHYGVQFHPESIGSQYGMALLNNFCQIVQDYKDTKEDDDDDDDDERLSTTGQDESTTLESIREEEESSKLTSSDTTTTPEPRFRALLHPLKETKVEPSKVFSELYSHRSTAMWLDSSSYPSRGEVDILAAPLSKDDVIEYHHHRSNKDDNNNNNNDILTQLEQKLAFAYDMDIGFVLSKGEDDPHDSTSIEWTKDTSVAAVGKDIVFEHKDDHQVHTRDDFPKIPFGYRGGYLGYLGYEVRHDTQRYLQEQESCHPKKDSVSSSAASPGERTPNNSDSTSVPTAAFFLARESMIYHHPTQQWYLLGLVEGEEDIEARMDWIQHVKERMAQLELSDGMNGEKGNPLSAPANPSSPSLAFVPNRPKERYAQDIASCHNFIELGESYELCLTNQLEATVEDATTSSDSSTTTLNLYQRLRRRNPAPYSAYFSWKGSLAICCSSPERFMSVQRRPTNNHPHHPTTILQAEAKPIKGTCARVLPADGIRRTQAETREDERRARSLELSLKNRAENLMIVDLLRNDMSRVCQIGSVHVAKLMDIESFATVHQMVSTIRGTLAPSSSSSLSCDVNGTIDLLRASFPGGSMTGAPKIRTMELLEELEDQVDRGPYSGSLGYLSINGCMDMNIIIRSAVVVTTKNDENDDTKRRHRVSIGAGGAITALSETQDEYDEMLLKARAVVEAVQEWAAVCSSSTTPVAPGSDVADTDEPELEENPDYITAGPADCSERE
jgi:para-aminobenzoate synthetase